ncbi:hypothetical protein [Kluyvera intermedia]|uniref:hypothetical protein n=1 Tax=Kluyvera intermedia TaxID=61648 RepID=UPI00372D842B
MKIETFLNKYFDVCDLTAVLTQEQIQEGIELKYGIDPKGSDSAEPDFILTKTQNEGWKVETINGVVGWSNLNEATLKKVLRNLDFTKSLECLK